MLTRWLPRKSGNCIVNRNIVEHYCYIQQFHIDTDPKFVKKIPGFNDIKNIVLTDAVELEKS